MGLDRPRESVGEDEERDEANGARGCMAARRADDAAAAVVSRCCSHVSSTKRMERERKRARDAGCEQRVPRPSSLLLIFSLSLLPNDERMK